MYIFFCLFIWAVLLLLRERERRDITDLTTAHLTTAHLTTALAMASTTTTTTTKPKVRKDFFYTLQHSVFIV